MDNNNNKNDVASWLSLLHTPKLGPVTALKILEYFSSPAELLATPRQELLDHGISAELTNHLLKPNQSAIEQSLQWAQADGNHIITWQDAVYPKLLKEISSAPLVLFVRGNPEVLSTTQLAMVGSRNPTPTGVDIAYQFAHHLVGQGFTITSGLALGVDAACHQGALAGKGQTIAVMGTGADQVYPLRHKALAKQILDQGGVLVTEFPPGTLPKAEHFPRRNRIISGLSLGTLVIEAAVQSGSLITAKYALEQGREVFAVPGSIHNPLARGCHALLKQGAKLVETANDVFEELKGFGVDLGRPKTLAPAVRAQCKLPELDSRDAKLVECLGFEMTTIDTLIERSSLGADVVSARLMMLELQGYVTAVPGGYVRKTV